MTAPFDDVTLLGHYAVTVRGTFDVSDIEELRGDMQVFDVTNPAHPIRHASIDWPAWSIQVVGDCIYLAGELGVVVLDASRFRHLLKENVSWR
ncbi:MAG: hypothetical protein ACRDG4_13000 [Chloroflexota bacterium]